MALQDHLVNPHLVAMAKTSLDKLAFIPAQSPDPSGGGGGMGGGMGGGAGGMPGGDPGAGAAPPPSTDGGAASAGGGATLDMVLQKLNQLSMGGGMAGAGGAPGSGAPLKPKIDVNVEMMQIKNMLAKICDHLQIPIPAQDMVATPEKLMAMSQGQPTATPGAGGGGAPGGDPNAGGGAIQPIQPMQGAGTPGAAGGKTAAAHVSIPTEGFAGMQSLAAALSTLAKNKQ